MREDRFDFDLLDQQDPFEIDEQIVHLFKHAGLGVADVLELWDTIPSSIPPDRRLIG